MRRVLQLALLLALLAWCVLARAQCMLALMGAGGCRATGPSTITLDGAVHGQHDNGAASSTTVVVGPIGTPTAGGTITCEFKFPYGGGASLPIYVTDNVNTGKNYEPLLSMFTDFNYYWGTVYMENVAASATTITLTATATGANGAMSCEAWKGTAPAYTVDSGFVQSSGTITGTNPTTGTSLTPFGNGRVIVGAVGMTAVTPTAGAGYTLIDSNASSFLFPEYRIQTTATATNAPYTAASDTYYDQMEAIAPNPNSGTCGVTTVMDWSGATNGTTATDALLRGSTKGNGAQVNANETFGPTGTWVDTGALTGLTYATGAYQPFVNTISCPFYSGTGTNVNSVGLQYSTTQAAHATSLNIDTLRNTVTAATCWSTNIANNDAGGPSDVFTIYADAQNGLALDFANMAISESGTQISLYLEANTNGPGTVISSGSLYWVRLTFVKGGTHRLDIYTGCGNNPTLLGSSTAPAIGGGAFADRILIGSAGAQTTTTGKVWTYGAVKVDALYGSALLP